MFINWQIFRENSVREVDEQFQKLYERRLEILTILVTSVIVAFLVNILTLPLETFVERATQILCIPKETIYMLLLFTLIACILIIGHFYYGKPIIFKLETFLLLNKDTGIVYPFHTSVEYSVTGTLALQRHLKDKGFLFCEKELSLKNPLLRDLLELFIVDWLISTTLFKAELLSEFSRPKIRYPKLGKQLKTLKTRDILAKFGENRFTKYINGEHGIMFSKIKLPEKLYVKCLRYEDSTINLGPSEEPLRIHLASELRIEGSCLTPLKIYNMITRE